MKHLLTATIARDGHDDMALAYETTAYTSAASRGDVLPVCMRIADQRRNAEWSDRLVLVREVGPVCPQEILDRACAFMPDAPEPKLLRAARSIVIASAAGCSATRNAWLAFARQDLLDAARLDALDCTVRSLLADLAFAA